MIQRTLKTCCVLAGILVVVIQTPFWEMDFWYNDKKQERCGKYLYSECRGVPGRGNGTACTLILDTTHGEFKIGYSPFVDNIIWSYLDKNKPTKANNICMSYQQGFFLHGERILSVYGKNDKPV